jgi:hypothetical protein
VKLILVGEKRTILLRWLRALDQSAKHRQELQKCVKGTGEWLLRADNYIGWKNDYGQLLWVKGIGKIRSFWPGFWGLGADYWLAGCGKSVLWCVVGKIFQVADAAY